MRPSLLNIASSGLLAVCLSCGDKPQFDPPLSIENCGGRARFDRPPKRVVAWNQTAAEVLIALGLEDSIVATGLQDNPPLPEFAEAYGAIPVRWSDNPTPEQFVEVRPDFAYATLASAFDHDVQRARESLRPFEVEVYLSPWDCRTAVLPEKSATIDLVTREIQDIASIFGVPQRGGELIAQMQGRLEAVRASSQRRPGPPPVVAWYDSGEEAPMLGAGGGILQLVTETARALNAFADASGSYTTRTWSDFAAADPNWIGLVDQLHSPAERKRAFLAEHPSTAQLRAVQEERYVVVPFSATLPGVGVASVAERLAAAIERDFRE